MPRITILLSLALISILSACGGGGGSGETPNTNISSSINQSSSQSQSSSSSVDFSNESSAITSSSSQSVYDPISPVPDDLWQPPLIGGPVGNYIYLESNDELFGSEQSKLFNNFNSEILFSHSFRSITINITGKQLAIGKFILMDSLLYPKVAFYPNTNNFQSLERNRARFQWQLSGFSCADTEGSWFAIDAVELDGDGKLQTIDIRFEQICAGSDQYLRGKIHWDRINKAKPTAPVYPVPSDVWDRTLSAEVEEQNYLYVEYQPSDASKALQTKLLSSDTFEFYLMRLDRGVSINVEPKEMKEGTLSAAITQGSELRVKEIDKGYYLNTLDYFSPAMSGISIAFVGFANVWAQDCDPYSAWFAVDDVSFVEGNPVTLDMRFGIDCKGAFNGKIHIVNNSRNFSADPAAIPVGLWEPAGVQASENMSYIYLLSEPSDYIGQGKSYEYTHINASLILQESVVQHTASARLQGYIEGDESWMFDLVTMPDQERFKIGLYEFDELDELNRVFIRWFGEGRSCNSARGWYTVDDVNYDEHEYLDTIDIRFAQFCGASPRALYGKIHWRSQDASTAPGPIFPVPQDLWQPPAEVTLPNYNYLYLESEADDYIGGGKAYLLTQRDARFMLETFPSDYSGSPGNRFDIDVYGASRVSGLLMKLNATLLEPGLYTIDHGPNPVKGEIGFSIDSRGCSDNSGWFAVDEIAFDTGGNLLSIRYRFEQRCGGDPTSALRGKGYWQRAESVLPPPPTLPVPADLWRPTNQDIPTSGNYLYLISEVGDWVGRGETELVTGLGVTHADFSEGWEVIVSSLMPQNHAIHIKGMYFHNRLQPGYYSNISKSNPVKGDITVSMYGRGCTNEDGWFAIDKVSYDAEGEITSLHTRFKQQCELSEGALYGQLKWDKQDD